jgi:hypothetical protein
MSWHILLKLPSIKFYEHTFRNLWFVSCLQMDGWVGGQRFQYVLHWDVNVPESVIVEWEVRKWNWECWEWCICGIDIVVLGRHENLIK